MLLPSSALLPVSLLVLHAQDPCPHVGCVTVTSCGLTLLTAASMHARQQSVGQATHRTASQARSLSVGLAPFSGQELCKLLATVTDVAEGPGVGGCLHASSWDPSSKLGGCRCCLCMCILTHADGLAAARDWTGFCRACQQPVSRLIVTTAVDWDAGASCVHDGLGTSTQTLWQPGDVLLAGAFMGSRRTFTAPEAHPQHE